MFTEVDQQEAEKLAREQEKMLNDVNMTIPPMEVILRYPIEVWVSSTKEFVPPEKVESKMESRRKKRAFRAAVSVELDMEKHILRQMRGLYTWPHYLFVKTKYKCIYWVISYALQHINDIQ